MIATAIASKRDGAGILSPRRCVAVYSRTQIMRQLAITPCLRGIHRGRFFATVLRWVHLKLDDR